VLELAETFEDQLFRAATDPTRVFHRGMTHCERVCRARGGFRTLDDLRDMNGKDRLVDFTDVRGKRATTSNGGSGTGRWTSASCRRRSI
jgi:hypothetical protein